MPELPIDAAEPITAELVAVLVAVSAGQPRVLTIARGTALPSGPYQVSDRSLQSTLRSWVERQTHHPLGYVEQLYTFADRGRVRSREQVISISYLGLTREDPRAPSGWRDWYEFFPWEDHRDGQPALLARRLRPALSDWADRRPDRARRIAVLFGEPSGQGWNEEFALQRHELLFEAGLVDEREGVANGPGRPMAHDHRRILATAIARLRAKIKYRPVVFELMPPDFTLSQLQQGVEAVAGRTLHKGNFRRLIEAQNLIEETGRISAATGGRPAKLFRFRRQVLDEREMGGSRPSVLRGGA